MSIIEDLKHWEECTCQEDVEVLLEDARRAGQQYKTIECGYCHNKRKFNVNSPKTATKWFTRDCSVHAREEMG